MWELRVGRIVGTIWLSEVDERRPAVVISNDSPFHVVLRAATTGSTPPGALKITFRGNPASSIG
jgi:mRNA-degrading endonuclease toxin of MazEF toxin-antitoxin module